MEEPYIQTRNFSLHAPKPCNGKIEIGGDKSKWVCSSVDSNGTMFLLGVASDTGVTFMRNSLPAFLISFYLAPSQLH